jgi:hypothetical protein
LGAGVGIGLESEGNAIVVLITVTKGLRFAFAFRSDTTTELEARVAYDVTRTIVGFERWISAKSRRERIRSIPVVEFDTWHNDRELGLVVDPVASQEVSSVVLYSTQEEAAELWADADGILDEQGIAASNLGKQSGSTCGIEAVDGSDDRIPHLDRAKRWVLDKQDWDSSTWNAGAT